MINKTKWLITGIKALGPVLPNGINWLKGAQMGHFPVIENAWLLTNQAGEIEGFGSDSDKPTFNPTEVAQYDAQGGLLIPGFVDSHTHIVFAKWREQEFVDRIKGRTYEEISASGGGILNSSIYLRETSEETLFEDALIRAKACMASGTVALEIKSGYGLDVASELKMLRVIKQLKETLPIPIKATFLGAHAIPKEFRENRNGYIDLILNEMLPQIAAEGLADYCDVFCDKGFFTPEESVHILKAASSFGIQARVHGNELGLTGGVQAAINVHAKSVDHLEHTTSEEWELLSNSETIPTLLPGTAFFLGIPYPEARKMIDYGLGVSLASDFNPGTCPSGNMAFVISLACLRMGMLPEEALNASMLNAAKSLDLDSSLGSIAIGKKASFIITKPMTSLSYIPYAFTDTKIGTVWINGQPLS